jgi:hypothetical protein
MATQNAVIIDEWRKIAETADSAVCCQSLGDVTRVEYATTATDAAPADGVIGHRLRGNERMTRTLIGAGYLWARLFDTPQSATLVVSGSSVDFTESDSET